MKLSDVVIRGQLLEIRCTDCYAKTPINPSFFLARRGDVTDTDLRSGLVCPGCGASEIGLESISPPQNDPGH